MDLKITKENIVDVFDWDKLVEKTYGRPYSFQQQGGCKSRGIFRIQVPDKAEDYKRESVPEIVNHNKMGVSFSAWLKRDPKTRLKQDVDKFLIRLWWERNFYPDIQMVANDLHERGLLEKGCYIIDIDW
ncbi:hypothetical protein LCGC14_0403680 [marine sediment metagenome]|uniref:Uncharacterized protein n=1 Tax=marine sediment metagenome TaxID=412755 RepID=A0A0F9SWB0_9ZZZZ